MDSEIWLGRERLIPTMLPLLVGAGSLPPDFGTKTYLKLDERRAEAAACDKGQANPGKISNRFSKDRREKKNERDPDLWWYRDRTMGMLRRYLQLSIEVGRLPSLLGREFFRTRVTSYSVGTFEDAVIFVHDVDRILNRLNEFDGKLIAKVVFQDYTQAEAAPLMGCTTRTVGRRLPEVIDRISKLFLEYGLLDRLEIAL